MSQERLVVLNGPLENTKVVIDGTVSIGRSPGNTLQLNDIQISRQHALIQQTQAGTLVRDLGSGNGTFIGERRIIEYRLTHGDVITVGPMEVRYEAGEVATPTGNIHTPGGSVRFANAAQEEDEVQAESAASVYQTFFNAPRDAADNEQLKAAQDRLAAVYEANQIIASERDLKRLFDRVMEQVIALTPAHNGVILLRDERSGELITEYVRTGSEDGAVTISSTIVSRAAEQGEAVITYNAMDDERFEAGASIIQQNIASAMCAPLVHQNETLGVIYVDTRGTQNAFTNGDLEMLVAIAGPASTAIKNAQYVDKLERAYNDTLVVIANAVELRDHYTVGHTWRVTNFSLEIAKELGWNEAELKRCQMGGVLHDVGKIAIADAILRKPGKLTDEEYEQMRVHPERGAEMMRDIEFLVPLIPFALYHHERFDGKGYPFGLSGKDIPIEGRVLAVADTFDAMTSNRPYRKGLDPEIAIQEIENGKGSQFDPECADAFIRAYRNGRIERILQDYYKDEKKSVACPFCSTYVPVGDEVNVGDEISCTVCHRRMRLDMQNEAYFAELVAATETAQGPPTPLPNETNSTTQTP